MSITSKQQRRNEALLEISCEFLNDHDDATDHHDRLQR